MKTEQRVEETIMQILAANLQLDMHRPVAARKKVAKEIIELFYQQTSNLKLINEKQGELIELYQNEPSRIKRPQAWYTWEDRVRTAKSELQSLQEGKEPTELASKKAGKEKEEGDTNWRKDGLPDPKDINPYDARSAKRIHDHFKKR